MKITSGRYKYRNIEIPRGIRPTTEKVREAVFSMINAWIPDAEVLDLFAGSGAMGLEALSRGSARCTFVESNRQNQKVLQQNIDNCNAREISRVIGRDFTAALAELAGGEEKTGFEASPPERLSRALLAFQRWRRGRAHSAPTPVSPHSPSFWLPAAPILCCASRFWLYRVGSAAAAYCWIPE